MALASVVAAMVSGLGGGRGGDGEQRVGSSGQGIGRGPSNLTLGLLHLEDLGMLKLLKNRRSRGPLCQKGLRYWPGRRLELLKLRRISSPNFLLKPLSTCNLVMTRVKAAKEEVMQRKKNRTPLTSLSMSVTNFTC